MADQHSLAKIDYDSEGERKQLLKLAKLSAMEHRRLAERIQGAASYLETLARMEANATRDWLLDLFHRSVRRDLAEVELLVADATTITNHIKRWRGYE